MKTYTIIGGVNGTGKSSLTGVLKAETADLGKIIDVDKLNIKYGDVIAGGKAAVKLISDCINNGISFTQETTLSGHKTASTAKLAREKGYFVRLYYVGLSSVEESIKRIANRAFYYGLFKAHCFAGGFKAENIIEINFCCLFLVGEFNTQLFGRFK